MERQALSRSAAVVISTKTHAEVVGEALALGPETRARSQIIPLSVPDPGPPAPIAPGCGDILFVGRATPRKGFDLLVAAAGALLDMRLADWQITVVGVSKAETAGLALRADVAARLCHVHAPDAAALAPLYARARIVVMPSRYESVGLVTLEAMSHGRPVVGFAAGGTGELVVDGETGLLAPPGDTEALARGIADLLSSEKRCQAMGQAGRARYLQVYSQEAFVRRNAALYAGLWNARNGGASGHVAP